MRSAFTERTKMQIIRTDYAIGTWKGLKVKNLIETLQKVPQEAIIIDFEEEENHCGGVDTILVFRVEDTQEKK